MSQTTIIIIIVAAVVIIAMGIAWALGIRRRNGRIRVLKDEADTRSRELQAKTEELGRFKEEFIRKEGELHTAEALRESEKAGYEKALADSEANHAKALAELKAAQEKAIEAARTALAEMESEELNPEFNETPAEEGDRPSVDYKEYFNF